MSNLVAIAYPDLGTAQTVAGELGQLTKEKSITLDDMVIIERRPDGKVKLHQSMSTGAAGAAGGALWGGLIGLIFLAPLLGMAVGAAAGGAAGALTDVGVDDNFLKNLGANLQSGGAAVVVLVRQSTPDKVIPRVSQYGGEVIQSSLDNEAETRLQEALSAGAAGVRRLMRAAIEAHLHSHHVARVIYGAIIGLSVILVQESHPPAAGVVVGSLIATAIAVALAELYSDVVATEARTHRRVARERLGEIGAGAAAVAFGVAFPAAFFLLAVAGAMELDTAFRLAKWSGLGLIGFYGFAAARLAGAPLLGCVLQALFAAMIGALLIALKALVH